MHEVSTPPYPTLWIPQVWNDNTGDKKPGPDVLVGKGYLPVNHLAAPDDDPPDPIGSGGRKGFEKASPVKGGGGEGGGAGGKVVTVRLQPGGRRRRRKEKRAGLVCFTLSYTSPRCAWKYNSALFLQN